MMINLLTIHWFEDKYFSICGIETDDYYGSLFSIGWIEDWKLEIDFLYYQFIKNIYLNWKDGREE